MSHNNLTELPRHTYVFRGQETLPDGYLARVEEMMIRMPIPNLPPEIELPASLEKEAAEIRTTIDDYIKQTFGIDISSRLPQRGQVHIFNTVAFAQLKEQMQLDKVEGFTARHHIYLPLSDQGEAPFIHDMTHEYIHLISGDVHKITTRPSDEPGRPYFRHKHLLGGYKVMEMTERHGAAPFRAMEEYLTEKMTKQILQHAGKLDALQVPGFSQLMPVGDKLVDIVARITGVSSQELLHELIRGQLTSNMKVLRKVLQVLGPMAKEFTHVDSRGESLTRFSQRLGRVAVQ